MATAQTDTTDASGFEMGAVERWKFSVADYHRLGTVGILEYDTVRDELIDGDVYVRHPSAPPHAGGSNRLSALLFRHFSELAILSVANPIRLSEYSEPLADLALLLKRDDYYRGAHPTPKDVLLVIEIVYFSTDRDRGIKLPAYARSGVPEVWLVDLDLDFVEVHRKPEGDRYLASLACRRGESISPLALPDVPLAVDSILGRFAPSPRLSCAPVGDLVMATAEKPSPSSALVETLTADDSGPCEGSAVRWKFSVTDYHRMGEAEIFDDRRVELIDGDVYLMSPIGGPHGGLTKWLNEVMTPLLVGRAIVSVGDPIRLNDHSEPQPDLALLHPRADHYRKSNPTSAEVYLVVEVMDSSARKDRGLKLPAYARVSLPEIWLIDLNQERIDVYRKPENGRYTVNLVARRGESIAPEAFPDVPLAVDAILGEN